MSDQGIQPGDRVMYVDAENIEWGPWEVVRMEGPTTTVRIEDKIVYEVPTDGIRRRNKEAESKKN